METPDPKYKHKPSEKHTLEEVLKSLQDLIRNDLAEGATTAGKPEPAPAAAEPPSRRENTSSMREDFAPVSPGSGPVNLDAVMRSLKDLVGNELNVGDEPKPPETKSESTHEEYLAAGEKIEEYIPEELGRLDDELTFAEEPAAATPAPPLDMSPAPEAIVEENPPQEFAPLDEELTFEEPAQTASPPPAAPETPELPGEISPEMLSEPEVAPPPTIVEPPPALKEDAASGTQHEMFFEEPTPIELRMPPSPAPETVSTSEPVPEPTPESPATPITEAPQSGDGAGDANQALPTIEVEESFDTGNYFDGAALSAEDAPETLEEIVVQDMEISAAPEPTPPTIETTPATPADAAPAPEPPAAPTKKKITLEIVSGPLLDNPEDRSEVDFDALGLEPSRPEPTPPPVAAEIPASAAAPPAITTEPDASPAPEPEIPKTAEATPAVETKAETTPEAVPPPALAEPGATKTPPTFSLDDIPVLNEVVAPPAGSAPAVKPDAPPSARPAPDRARDVVVRAVAKLNVEMRKTGGTGLDTKTILRLQQLIRQELEKGGEK